MGQDRRLGENRRMSGDRRFGNNQKGYNGPERRCVYDRRDHNERRQEKYVFSGSNPIPIAF